MNSAEQNQGKFKAQLPLLSKLRGKQRKLWGKSSHNSTSIEKEDEQCLPINMSMEKSHPKASFLDRIASLEDRLVQLCLEIESYKKSSCSSSTDKSSGASSSSGSKTEGICSYPTFDIRNGQSKRQSPDRNKNNVEFEENSNKQLEQKLKISNSTEQQYHGKKRSKRTSRNGKKNIGPSWPHLKILGC